MLSGCVSQEKYDQFRDSVVDYRVCLFDCLSANRDIFAESDLTQINALEYSNNLNMCEYNCYKGNIDEYIKRQK